MPSGASPRETSARAARTFSAAATLRSTSLQTPRAWSDALPYFPAGTESGLAMADPKAVPAGKYGRAALESLGVWQAVEPRVAAAENVRAALALVSRGEAPLGIVYQTDAAADPNVKIAGMFPEDTHPPIIYPAAVTGTSTNGDSATFLAYMQAPGARPAWEKHGFTVLK